MWCGMVWCVCGVVWCGVVCVCGVVWCVCVCVCVCGVVCVWCGVVWCGVCVYISIYFAVLPTLMFSKIEFKNNFFFNFINEECSNQKIKMMNTKMKVGKFLQFWSYWNYDSYQENKSISEGVWLLLFITGWGERSYKDERDSKN